MINLNGGGYLPRMGLIICLSLVLLTADLQAQPLHRTRDLPFAPGEKLIFELKWGLVPAGQATLEVLPMTEVDGQPAYHFVMTAKSNAFVDVFYKVRDRIDAYTDPTMDRSIFYKKSQQEGKSRREIVVTFDWPNNEATYTNFDQEKISTSLLPNAFDPLAIMYFIRTLNLEPGMLVEQPVTDGKKSVVGRTRVTAGKRLKFANESFDTLHLEPELKHIGGVFEKSSNARMELWLSRDHAKVPVKLKSKVVVGSFTATLTTITRPTEIRARP